jgi:hemerythrin
MNAHNELDYEFAVGSRDVDDGHRELLQLFNRIEEACTNRETVSLLREKIRSFLVYARWHFAIEERWMSKMHYTLYAKHKSEHDRLLQDAEDFIDNLGESLTADDSKGMALYFRTWLARHMANDDLALKEFVESNNVELS